MPSFTEKSLVEDYVVEKLQERGWRFVPPEELGRESLEDALLAPALARALRRLNSDVGIGDDEIEQAMNELVLKTSGSEGVRQILRFLKFGVPVKPERDKGIKYVRLFDYRDPGKNEFVVSRQVVHRSGKEEIRNDMLLYVNGIPLVNVECKNPANFAESVYNAYAQIKRYERTVPELYKYVQIGVAARETALYFPIVPWLSEDEVRMHTWREEGLDPIDSMIEMLRPDTLLNIVKNYLFYRIEHGSATKVIARYMQYRAAEKIYRRTVDHVSGADPRDRGLIWHWQGSGKTLTMIFAAAKLYYDEALENPTIFFIVDREELEEQLVEEFNALDLGIPAVDRVYSIEKLRSVLEHDEGRGKRGVIITLIQKFRPDELQDLGRSLERMEARNLRTIRGRRNVVAFVDEGHRTQYGTLAAQMRSLLKNATFYAFTGTPIAKGSRDTYYQFSNPPEEMYLDKYFITDSIEDGFTLKIVYQPRLERDVHLKRELLEGFLEAELEEIPEEFRERTEEKLKGKMNAIRVFLENPERIRKVAEDLSEHFRENVDGRFKAVVVAVSRKACVLYKRALDELLPPEYSEVVMTFSDKDPEIISDYRRELAGRYPGMDDDGVRKEIVRRYKEEELPKMLVVTDMLLTGFDAPILQTMYLDKPLKEHRLLQAIARTNRPYMDVKEAGLVIDYVGILKHLVRAFEMYSKDEVKGALFSVDDVRKEFLEAKEKILGMLGEVPRDDYGREAMQRAMEVLTTDEAAGREFVDLYRRMRKSFELLGPDEVKLENFSDYKWITAIYTYYYNTVLRSSVDDADRYARKYFRKTLKYVYKSTELEDFQRTLPAIEFDDNYLRNLEEKLGSKEERAANLVFTLNRFVLVDKSRNPIYESLSERVERLVEMWRERTKDYEKIYSEGVGIIQEMQKLRERQRGLGLGGLQYSVLLKLEERLGRREELVGDVRRLFESLGKSTFRGWQTRQSARKEVERDVRRFLRKYIVKHGLSVEDVDALSKEIMEVMYEYGAN
ncbi:MAG: type I restriction endonuclease subunit R [Conexivisphaera sp.]